MQNLIGCVCSSEVTTSYLRKFVTWDFSSHCLSYKNSAPQCGDITINKFLQQSPTNKFLQQSLCVCVCMYIDKYIWIYLSIYNISIYRESSLKYIYCMYVYICICMCVYVYIYIYIYTHTYTVSLSAYTLYIKATG